MVFSGVAGQIVTPAFFPNERISCKDLAGFRMHRDYVCAGFGEGLHVSVYRRDHQMNVEHLARS